MQLKFILPTVRWSKLHQNENKWRWFRNFTLNLLICRFARLNLVFKIVIQDNNEIFFYLRFSNKHRNCFNFTFIYTELFVTLTCKILSRIMFTHYYKSFNNITFFQHLFANGDLEICISLYVINLFHNIITLFHIFHHTRYLKKQI